jgi:putative nucleotidyltransferase with HDIG domain
MDTEGTELFLKYISEDFHVNSPWTLEHMYEVSQIAETLYPLMPDLGVPKEEFLMGAFFHDVGKLYVPKKILNSHEPLTELPLALMRYHAEQGWEILRQYFDEDHPIPLIALYHHERSDGAGYPEGLTVGQIPPFVSMVSAIDTFHGKTSYRPYKPTFMTVDEGLQRIIAADGSRYHPQVSDTFSEASKTLKIKEALAAILCHP